MSTTAARHRKRQVTSNPWIVELFEHAMSPSPAVDRAAGVIRNVKVLGNVSKNNRTYSDRAKQDACKLLEGITVNFDHKRRPEDSERGFMEGIGTLHGLTVKPDGVYADELRVKKSHPNAEVLFESAERFPNSFGLSINAAGTTNKAGDIVESIKHAHSVDIVGNPATTNGLFESTNPSVRTRRMIKTSIKKIIESMGNAKYSKRCSKIMEDGAGAAVMGAPVDMEEPAMGDDGNPTEPDPLDQVDDAFKALIASIAGNDGMALADQIKQMTAILTMRDQLLNGGGGATKSVKEDDQSDDDDSGDDDMKESAKQINAKLDLLIESNNRNAMSIRLIDKGIEPTPERLTALLGAKDESAIVSLMESFPPKQKIINRVKPIMRSSEEPTMLPKMPDDAQTFAMILKN